MKSMIRIVGRIQLLFVLKDRTRRIVRTNVNALFGAPVAAVPKTKKEARAMTAMANQATNDAERITVGLKERRMM